MQAIHAAQQTRGFTLVELMVALLLSLMVVAAAYAVLMVSSQGFGAVNAAVQLRDNARFAAAVLDQLVLQAGYQNDAAATGLQAGSGAAGFAMAAPVAMGRFVYGESNKTLANQATPVNQSDVLYLRAMAAPLSQADDRLDKALLNCAGVPHKGHTALMESRLYVAMSQGEPALMCQYPHPTAANTLVTEPLIEGVEVFRVLFGVNEAADGDPPALGESASRFRYLPASGIHTDAQWRQVRSVRMGLVLRAKDGSAAQRQSHDYWVFGKGVSGAAHSFTSPADARLRQVVTLTVQLRNNPNPVHRDEGL